MRISAYVIVAISAFLLTGSLISIVLLLDKGAQSAIENVISNLQEKTLALSTTSIAKQLTSLQAVVDWNLKDYKTGLCCYFVDEDALQHVRDMCSGATAHKSIISRLRGSLLHCQLSCEVL